jgi:hypothetical protein
MRIDRAFPREKAALVPASTPARCRRRHIAVSPGRTFLYAYDAAIEGSSIIVTAIPRYETGACAILARNENVSAQL